MLDLSRIEGFDWDAGNRAKSVAKHGVSIAEAEQVFLNEPLIVSEDFRHSESEARFQALGQTDGGRRLFVAFTLRRADSLIRVISARDMNAKERQEYAQEGT